MPRVLVLAVLFAALPALAQHDISTVEPTGAEGSISTPMPQQRRMKRYELPELAGARQALGSQLIDGRLPRPLVDFTIEEGIVKQRISIFEGGLVIVKMTGPATIRKKLLIPADALKAYVGNVTATSVAELSQASLSTPVPGRLASLRAYDNDGHYVERVFNPGSVPPKRLNDFVAPLRDLLRAMSEDREVTSSVTGYVPKEGDELVADDQKVYRVVRVVGHPGVVELQGVDTPTTMYVTEQDLHLYFIGTRGHE